MSALALRWACWVPADGPGSARPPTVGPRLRSLGMALAGRQGHVVCRCGEGEAESTRNGEGVPRSS